MIEYCKHLADQSMWGGPHRTRCDRYAIKGFDYCIEHISKDSLMTHIADLERQLAEEREVNEAAKTKLSQQYEQNEQLLARVDFLKNVDAVRLEYTTLQAELAALKQRFDNAPKTTATYWDVHERHQRPYTSLASIWRDPLDLAPGEPCNVRIVKEQP